MRGDCDAPLSPATTWGYWLGEIDETEAEAVDRHAFDCESCFVRLRAAERIVRGLGRLVAMTPPPTLTVAQLDELKKTGRSVHEFPVDARGVVHGLLPPDAEIAVLRVRVDLAGVRRIEISFCRPDGTAFVTVPAVFDPSAAEVLIACEAHLARAYESIRFRLRAVDPPDRGEIGDVLFVRATSIPT